MGGDAAFQAFIRDFEPTAIAAGITPETYNRAMAGVTPIAAMQQVIDNQPEFARQIWTYLDGTVSVRRVANAKIMLTRYADVLARMEARSGVPKEILVAIWGMETDYGGSAGEYNLFASLATQSYTGPRQQYARRELLAALKIMQQQNYPLSEMVSSWAGAFGQTQFMPSTFFKYATDGDGDGKIDLWTSSADALASTAALLANEGWQTGKPWGYEVKLPANFDYSQADLDGIKPLSTWAAMGVKTASGAVLPAGDDPVSLYLPAGRAWSGLCAVPQFPRHHEIQQCRRLCPGGRHAGGPHGGRRTVRRQMAARGKGFVARRAHPVSERPQDPGLRSGRHGWRAGTQDPDRAAALPEIQRLCRRRFSHRHAAGGTA